MTTLSARDEITRIPMSWTDYLALDEDVRGEYYEGALVVVPPPGRGHQVIQYELQKLLEHHLRPGTAVIHGWGWPPEGVREELVPDLMVHEVTRDQRSFSGVPLLVAEILSTNRRDDFVAKLNRYAQWAAPSYWIVDPRDHQILTHELRDGYFAETGRFTGGQANLVYRGVTATCLPYGLLACKTAPVSDLINLRDGMRRFTEERDWSRFHDPKSLVLALVGEVGELAELFQWLPAGSAAEKAHQEPLHTRVEEEISDVLLYLVRLADVLEVDLAQAATRKIESSSGKHQPGQEPTRYILGNDG